MAKKPAKPTEEEAALGVTSKGDAAAAKKTAAKKTRKKAAKKTAAEKDQDNLAEAAQIPLTQLRGPELDAMRVDLSHRVINVENLEEGKKDALAAMNRKLRKARKDMLAVARVLEEQQQAFG